MLENTKELLLYKYHTVKKGGWKAWLLAKGNTQLKAELQAEYPQLSDITEMMFWLDNNLTDFPKCPVCGQNIVKFMRNRTGYPGHCSKHCTQLDADVRLKYKQTNLDKYGCDNGAQSPESISKRKATCLRKYGVDNIFKDKEYIKECCIEKLGVENSHKLPSVIEKQKKTLQERYGVTCACALAYPFQKSRGEQQVAEFIESLKLMFERNDRKIIYPMELDIYIPEFNVAIEYDGDYWHSLPEMVERDIKKDTACLDKQIKLIRVKESDWISDSETIKNKILEELKNNGFKFE